MRQYLTAKFRPADKRAYTYHNDGPPVAIGDEVKLPSTRGQEGWVRGTVFGIITEAEALAQPHATKEILGRADPKPVADLLDTVAAAPSRNDPKPTLGDPQLGEWRPFQPGDSVPTTGMFEVTYRTDRAPETMPADKINWQHVSRFRAALDAPAAAPGQTLFGDV